MRLPLALSEGNAFTDRDPIAVPSQTKIGLILPYITLHGTCLEARSDFRYMISSGAS